ncbi:MAG: hypothetical protein ABF381_13775 [Akkermansiaceae bacterium]
MSDEKKSLGLLARVVRALGDSKPPWLNRLFAVLLAPLLLASGGMIAEKWISAVNELVRSIWWEETKATLVEDHGQTAPSYVYEFEEEAFSGTRLSFGDASDKMGKKEIEQFTQNQPSASAFTVYVNPDSASESVVQRALTPKTWMAIPLSLILLVLGVAMVGYALLPTIAYWWRGKLRVRFMEGVPELIMNSLKDDGGQPKLLFSSMTTVHRGIRLLVWAVFWILLVLLVVAGGLLMMKLGDLRWRYVGGMLAPFFLVGLLLGWLTFRRLKGPQPPGFVFFFDGWRSGNSIGEDDKVSVHWISDPDEKDNFRSCRVGLGRWPEGQSFRKWKKNHPDWRDTLVDISQGTVGAHGFDLESVGRFDGPAMLGEEVHLVMIWQEWDGKVRQASMYLGELHASPTTFLAGSVS